MNLGQILGGALTVSGIVLGVTTFSITGATINFLKFPEWMGVYAGVCSIVGIVTFLSSREKSASKGELGAISMFSERN